MADNKKVRIDKWLWAVRIYKTRTLATDSCNSRKVKIDGNSVKPSKSISIGQVITVQKGYIKKVYKVIGLIEKRGSAKIAQENVEDLTPPEEKLKQQTAFSPLISFRERGRGRPTKKERRQMDKSKQSF